MTENKRYSFNWERGHPNFWDNHCDLADCYLTCEDVVELLNTLNDENEQLKQRNNRQAKRLGELYELMAKKDWDSLTEIIDDFCSCEEQLQRESGTYSDWND